MPKGIHPGGLRGQVGRLRCDVSVLSFSDLFVHLFNSGKSGVLTVFQGTMKKSFYVNADGVTLLATTGQARSMGEMLIRTRKVSRAQLDQLLDEKAMSGRRLAELVQRRGLLTAEDVHIAKRDHVEEELHELFTWRNAVCVSPPWQPLHVFTEKRCRAFLFVAFGGFQMVEKSVGALAPRKGRSSNASGTEKLPSRIFASRANRSTSCGLAPRSTFTATCPPVSTSRAR
jgi:hypothetical protein